MCLIIGDGASWLPSRGVLCPIPWLCVFLLLRLEKKKSIFAGMFIVTRVV